MANSPAYSRSIYAQFFEQDNAAVVNLAENFMEKLYKNGIVPKYIQRGKNNSANGEDVDYISFWTAVSYYFAWSVVYSRQFLELEDNRELLYDYLVNKGMGVNPDSNIEELQYVMRNFYDEIRKRGTVNVFKQFNAEPDDVLTNGEFLRLIGYKETDEFKYVMTSPIHFGWCIGRCSPLYRGTGMDYQLIKGYENTEDLISLDEYPLLNPSGVAKVNDGTIDKDVFELSEDGSGIGYLCEPITEIVVIPDSLYSFSLGANDIIEDIEAGMVLGDVFTFSIKNLLTLVTSSIGIPYATTSATEIFDYINDYINTNSVALGYTSSYEITLGTTVSFYLTVENCSLLATPEDVLANTWGFDMKQNGVSIFNMIPFSTEGGSPSVCGYEEEVVTGETCPIPDKLIVIDKAVNYEITCGVLSTAQDGVSMGVTFFDIDKNKIYDIRHVDDIVSDDGLFFEDERMYQDNRYYHIRALCIGVNEAERASEDSGLDIGFGKHIKIPCGAVYMIPRIILDNEDDTVNGVVRVYDFKVRIADTVYSRGFIQTPNVIQVWAKNNNGSYNTVLQQLNNVVNPISNKEVVTIPLLEDFTKRYLIPYNSSIIFNWLGNISVCEFEAGERSYSLDFDLSFDS